MKMAMSTRNRRFATAAFSGLIFFLFATAVKASSKAIEQGYIPTEDGTRLFYVKAGNGAPVVILPLRLFTWHAFEALADQFTLIGYDPRGRGCSDPIPDEAKPNKISLERDVLDVETIRRHFNLQKISLIGYSYTGLMIVLYALDHPETVERLVQLGPVPIKFGTKYPPNLAASDKPGKAKALQRLRELQRKNYPTTNPQKYCEQEWAYTRFGLLGDAANVAKLGSSPCKMPNEWPVNLARHFEFSFVSVQKLDLSKDKIRTVKGPVLTVHGMKDRNAPYGGGREWALTLPNARLLTVKNGAHQSFDEFPEIVIPAVRTFLGGQWPNAAQQITSLEL
jgi:Predicted hydrolases or acyltransferases (alpha/beta hydrolase superfamily)